MNNDNKACLIIPDIHHKVGMVERIRANHPGCPQFFSATTLMDFYDTPAHMEVTCRWLKQAIGRGQDKFLLGNHCFAYLSYELSVRWRYCSGWDVGKQQVFNRDFPGDMLLKSSAWIAHCQDWLITHAGLTRKLYRSFSKRNTSDEIL